MTYLTLKLLYTKNQEQRNFFNFKSYALHTHTYSRSFLQSKRWKYHPKNIQKNDWGFLLVRKPLLEANSTPEDERISSQRIKRKIVTNIRSHQHLFSRITRTWRKTTQQPCQCCSLRRKTRVSSRSNGTKSPKKRTTSRLTCARRIRHTLYHHSLTRRGSHHLRLAHKVSLLHLETARFSDSPRWAIVIQQL